MALTYDISSNNVVLVRTNNEYGIIFEYLSDLSFYSNHALTSIGFYHGIPFSPVSVNVYFNSIILARNVSLNMTGFTTIPINLRLNTAFSISRQYSQITVVPSADIGFFRTLSTSGVSMPSGSAPHFSSSQGNESSASGYFPVVKLIFSNIASTPSSVSNPPTIQSVVAGNSNILIQWTKPSFTGYSPIIKYVATTTPGNVSNETSDGAFNNLTLSGLTNGTSYTIALKAVNLIGDSTAVNSSSITPFSLPDPPTIQSLDFGNSQITIGITPPDNTGGFPLTGYQIVSIPATTTVNIGVETSYTFTGLTNGTAYRFSIASITARGTGNFSSNSGPVIPGTTPSAPSNIIASGDDGKSTLTWTADNNGGYAISNFIITSVPETTTENFSYSGFEDLEFEFTGLTNDISYVFYIVAQNTVGNSTAGTSNTITPRQLPSAPQDVSATISSGNDSVLITWNAPSFLNGTSRYRIRSSPSAVDISQNINLGRTITFPVSNFIRGTSYTFRVSAINSTGSSSETNSNSVAFFTIPSAPTNLQTMRVSSTSLSLTWTEPENKGGTGATLEGYVITILPDNRIISTTRLIPQILIQDLVAGSLYTFRVVAVNVAGESSPGVSGSIAAGILASAPRNLSTSNLSPVRGTINWTEPDNAGSFPIINYRIQLGRNTQTVAANARSATFDLSHNTTYSASVNAITAIGNGTSSSISFTSPDYYTPRAPTNILVERYNDITARIRWTAPTDDGGRPILYYNIYSQIDGELLDEETSDALLYFYNIPLAGVYRFRVSAVNSIGEGTLSVPSTPMAFRIVPEPPRIIRVVGGRGFGRIFWEPVNESPYARIQYYNVSAVPFAGTNSIGAPRIDISTNKTDYSFFDLAIGVDYYFEIDATNEIDTGDSTDSREENLIIRTTGAPPTPIILDISAGYFNNNYILDIDIDTTETVRFSELPTQIRITISKDSNSESFVQTLSGIFNIKPYRTIHRCVIPSSALGLITNGQNHGIKVAYINRFGESRMSELYSVKIDIPPNRHTSFTAEGGNEIHSVKLNWEYGASRGSNIVRNFITYYPTNRKNEAETIQVNVSDSDGFIKTTTITDLERLTEYTFEIYITNATYSSIQQFGLVAGNVISAVNNSISVQNISPLSVKCVPNSYPDPPRNITLKAQNRSASVMWEPPIYTGGLSITKYIITNLITSVSMEVFHSSLIRTATFTDLSNGDTYNFSVKAVGSLGQSTAALSSNITLPIPVELINSLPLPNGKGTFIEKNVTIQLGNSLISRNLAGAVDSANTFERIKEWIERGNSNSGVPLPAVNIPVSSVKVDNFITQKNTPVNVITKDNALNVAGTIIPLDSIKTLNVVRTRRRVGLIWITEYKVDIVFYGGSGGAEITVREYFIRDQPPREQLRFKDFIPTTKSEPTKIFNNRLPSNLMRRIKYR